MNANDNNVNDHNETNNNNNSTNYESDDTSNSAKADLKRKKYKLSKKIKNIESEQEEVFLTKKNGKKDDIDENINDLSKNHFELKNLNKNKSSSLASSSSNNKMNSQKQNNIKSNNNTTNNPSSPNKKPTTKLPFIFKLDNLLDLNFKFDSVELENNFKNSYLSITRSLYIKYLFYLILFTLSWLIYFILYNHNQIDLNLVYATISTFSSSSLSLSNETLTNPVRHVIDYNFNNSGSYFPSPMSGSSFNWKILLIVYLSLITIIFTLIFVFLLVIELKEQEHRKLGERVHRQEQKNTIDIKDAEKDLKIAMEKILDQERKHIEIRKKISNQSMLVSKLRSIYSKCAYILALIVLILMFILNFLIFFIQENNKQTYLTQISHFIWFTETILLFYLIYPFQLIIPITVGVIASILFEILTIRKQFTTNPDDNDPNTNEDDNDDSFIYLQSQMIIFIFIKILLHTSIHLMAGYLKFSLELTKRDTFFRLAHMNKAHMTSQQDKQITERMIKSIMPPLFTHVFGKPEEFKKKVNCVHQMRPLFIYPVSEISILFADIVGFTKMSSNKTAEELVFLLNDLYGRFDKICEQSGCEKISTLGDCYYCVSGCLNGREDHAKCCVEMGLLMVKEIELFNKKHNVDVNMRVGVHTGKALCGFIGGKRFRFDVWSSDVTLANKMESSGRPGWVHISEDTFKKLDNKFSTEPGEKYSGKATYFVIRESKHATVADALKMNESLDMINNKAQENANETDENMETLINNEESNRANDESLLLLGVKDAQFFQPEVNFLTLNFKDREDESKFQGYLTGVSNNNSNNNDLVGSNQRNQGDIRHKSNVWTNPQNLLFLSILMSFIINLCVSTAFFLTFIVSTMTSYKHTTKYKTNFYVIISIYCVLFLMQILFLFIYFMKCSSLLKKNTNNSTNSKRHNSTSSQLNPNSNYDQSLKDQLIKNDLQSIRFAQRNNKKLKRNIIIKYTLIHLVSFLFLTIIPIYMLATGLPTLCNISDYLWSTATSPSSQTDYLTPKRLNLFSLYLYFTYTIALINFCSFVQLSSLFKTILAIIFALTFGLMGLFGIQANLQQQIEIENSKINLNSTSLEDFNQLIAKNSFSFYTSLFLKGFYKENLVSLMDLFFLILLIWFINRQSELIQRLSFKCDQDANLRITNAREQKELANWLIEVVIPAHVVSHVKEKKQYSKNYECVGVLFVSLCNFSEFFEESYESGRELLRVLNEISVDFDRLFDEPKYKSVEKIKSIGSTFMIASGLSPEDESTSNKNNSHLYDLMDFALELNEKLEAFNNEAMSVCHFKFQMRMGYNCGPVTAGVIGTDRLLYDIWGDTVNVASRMDSTGQGSLLQTPDKVAHMLSDKYKFFERGTIQIKGKDQMTTYLLNPKENQKSNQ